MTDTRTKATTWGHMITPKEPSTIQILLQNISGINMTGTGSIKLAALQNYINEVQADICAITEWNVDWKQAPAHLYPTEQTRYWWENSQWSITHNTHKTNKTAYQPGGMVLVIINQLSHQAQCPGDDKVGLGQWCWARLWGKNNKILRIVSAYCPCKSEGILTTYQQHVWFGAKQNTWTCPRLHFLQDWSQDILSWTEDGEEVIVLADMNDDVLDKDILQFCKTTSLVEAISSIHSQTTVPTHQRGSKPINRIFISKNLLEDAKGGFLDFGVATISDHRAIWLNIKASPLGMEDLSARICE